MKIEIFSDLACPWCFIGKRRLERALAECGADAELEFRAFQLQPGLPAQGVPAAAFFERKFGGAERARGQFQRVAQVGREDGIEFAFERQRVAPNTELAHRLIRFAASRGRATQAVEALFRGYFELGLDLSNAGELIEVLERPPVGLPGIELVEALSAGYGQEQVADDSKAALEYGIAGVPLFLFDRRYAVEGAQPVAHFTRLIRKIQVEDAPHLRAQSLR